MSEPWYGLYYDVKAQIVDFAALEPGDVIDIEYVVSDMARRNLFADYFGELHVLAGGLAARRIALCLDRAEIEDALLQPAAPGRGHARDREPWRRHASTPSAPTNVPKVDAEPGMPGFTDVAAYVHVSTYKTWEDVAQPGTRGLVTEQLQPSAAIHDAVMDAVKGVSEERARIRAVYDLVVRKTRYVGLEFGIHGYQPYRTTQVFARKFGDCKDKASLLVVMLREIGVEASLVLARTRRGGDLDAAPASLAPFDHAIV